MDNHYFTTKLVKMGKWALYPLDTEAWMSEEGSFFFKKYFGILKGILTIHDPLEHAYIPEDYFVKLHNRIREITSKNHKGLEKVLKKFYETKRKVKGNLFHFRAKDYSKLSNKELARLFKKNREQVHLITVFDQFGWIAEEYWTPLMAGVLTGKLGLKKEDAEYNRILFTLTKPDEISTTLAEKRDILKSILAVKGQKSTVEKEATKLSHAYGWMPVFAFGDAWDARHYAQELNELLQKPEGELTREYDVLKNYRKTRKTNVEQIVKQYKLSPKDLQIFIDFGLALDARNEAEYCLSFGGFYVRPMYEEIARRLEISVPDLRLLYENEILECLSGKVYAKELLKEKRGWVAYGYDEEMKERINFGHDEAKRLFEHIESYVKNVQGGDEFKGTCASSGKATGVARIVHSTDENHKVQNGYILITHATTVDYLPAMKKAAAIITEVGGLTCHAAVVSREFGIPCVVALKNAMKNFKDGDKILVDADRGIVTVLK